MSEWHVTPDYIVNNWTDELLDLMTEKLVERKQKEAQALKGTSSPVASVEELEAKSRGLIKVVKK